MVVFKHPTIFGLGLYVYNWYQFVIVDMSLGQKLSEEERGSQGVPTTARRGHRGQRLTFGIRRVP